MIFWIFPMEILHNIHESMPLQTLSLFQIPVNFFKMLYISCDDTRVLRTHFLASSKWFSQKIDHCIFIYNKKICNVAATFLETIKSKIWKSSNGTLNIYDWIHFLHPVLWLHYPDVIKNVVATFKGHRNVPREDQEQNLPHHNVALVWFAVSPHDHFCRKSPERDLFVGKTVVEQVQATNHAGKMGYQLFFPFYCDQWCLGKEEFWLLSPYLFAFCLDELSEHLSSARVRCTVGNMIVII